MTDLQNLLEPSRTITFDFPGFEDFEVELCYLAREELIKLRKRCLSVKFDKKTHKPIEDLDEEKFLKIYCTEVVKGWTGLKYKYLEELLLVDVSEMDPEDELPFTVDNAILLMKNSPSFEGWVADMVEDLGNFTKRK